MTRTLVFASNNQNKLREIAALLDNAFDMVTLEQAGITEDLPEPYFTLEENAQSKARYLYEQTGQNCFSEDTGLEVAALDGMPGALSARYAGEEKSADANMARILAELEGNDNRKARFRTVICLILDGQEYLVDGVCEGSIATGRVGEKGFGYDPIFVPDGETRSFGEMEMDEKAQYSHRSKAFKALKALLKTI